VSQEENSSIPPVDAHLDVACDLHLEPLLRPYGFVKASSGPNYVEFLSPKVRVVVRREFYSSEINLAFELVGLKRDGLDLAAIVEPDDADGHAAALWWQASTCERINLVVGLMARDIAQHCSAVLKGDERVFECLYERRRDRQIAAERMRANTEARSAADAAWRTQDFPGVVRELSRIVGGLSHVERLRFEYAKRH
jgi:hypothetical protein